MTFKGKLAIIQHTSLLKTLRFNIHYFGFTGNCPVLLSRNVSLVKLSGSVKLSNKQNGVVKLGYGDIGIVDKKYRRFLWQNSGEVCFDGRVDLGVGTKIANSGHLYFGDNSRINANTDIVCKKSVSINKDSLISWECLIMDTDFHEIYDIRDPGRAPLNEDKAIVIGEHVWIGARSTILKGANIPSNTIVAACSLITRELGEEFCIYSSDGVIKRNVTW